MWQIFLTFFVPVVVLLGWLWWHDFRDERVKRPVVPEYTPPDKLSVLEMGVLMDNRLDYFDVSVALYELILQGHLIKKGQHIVIADVKAIERLPDVQQSFVKILFENLAVTSVDLADLHHLSKKKMFWLKRYVYSILTVKKYYKVSPMEQRKSLYALAYAVMTIGLLPSLFVIDNIVWAFLMLLFGNGPGLLLRVNWSQVLFAVPFLVMGLLVGLFAENKARKTLKGVEMAHRLRGLRLYIATAEEDRIRYVLEHEPDTYLKILPAAYLFGFVNRWEIGEARRTLRAMRGNQVKDAMAMHMEFGEALTTANGLVWVGRFVAMFFTVSFWFFMSFLVEAMPWLGKIIPEGWRLEGKVKLSALGSTEKSGKVKKSKKELKSGKKRMTKNEAKKRKSLTK